MKVKLLSYWLSHPYSWPCGLVYKILILVEAAKMRMRSLVSWDFTSTAANPGHAGDITPLGWLGKTPKGWHKVTWRERSEWILSLN